MRTQRGWWAWPVAGSAIMALYVAGLLAANDHPGSHRQGGAGFGYAIGGMFFGAMGFLILGAEWSIAMRPGVRRRWIGDVVRTLCLVTLLVLPARDLWG